MIFTAGKDRFFEWLMQQKPGFDRSPVLTMKERDCRHCLYYDEHRRQCGLEKCIVFSD